jgi:hypothetical protein
MVLAGNVGGKSLQDSQAVQRERQMDGQMPHFFALVSGRMPSMTA